MPPIEPDASPGSHPAAEPPSKSGTAGGVPAAEPPSKPGTPGATATGVPADRGGHLRRLGRDYAYILPGLPIATLGLLLLVPLTLASLVSFIVWAGAVLMPLTLMVASRFARLSRRRLLAWGVDPAPVEYKPAGPGLSGRLRLMTDPRRWLDLVFEVIIAFPLRLATFAIAVTWTAGALGGLTSWLWRLLRPDESQWTRLLGRLPPDLVPQSPWGGYLLESGIDLLLGALALLALPAVIHGLAWVDASLTVTVLNARPSALAGTRLAWAGVTLGAMALLAVGWPVLTAVHGLPTVLAMVLSVAQSLAVVLAVRRPGAAIGLSALAALGTMYATAGTAGQLPWPWPVTTLLAYCLMVAVVGLSSRWFWAAVSWTVGAVLTALAFVAAGQIPDGGLANGIVLVAVTAGLALLGALGRLWIRNAGRVEQAERLSAEEAQRRHDLEERSRIARELHDVVAHSMSVINVQASTAQYRKPGMDAAVRREFDDIARSSRQALGEMRALLAILRDDEDPPTAPVPGLGDVPDLVEATRASGTTITCSGTAADVPPTVGLTAFRAVQEALSNALRHAPGAAIDVVTAVDDDGLKVDVVNSAPEPGAEPTPGSGLGLAGIRERVAALGGTVEAGPTPEGGFAVSVFLPVGGTWDAPA